MGGVEVLRKKKIDKVQAGYEVVESYGLCYKNTQHTEEKCSP